MSSRRKAESTLHRATAYPYVWPAGSYLLRDGVAEPLPGGVPPELTRGRRPVLACGSNRAPEALARKFGDGLVPVSRVRLADFDAVYSAHFSVYGALPATLRHSLGTTVELAVTWLGRDQLAAMHVSESVGINYVFGRLQGIDLRLDDGTRHDSIEAYVSRRGCLTLDGSPVALAAVAADGRSLPALDEPAMLEAVRRRLAPRESLAMFVTLTARDQAVRLARTGWLRRQAVGLGWDGFTPLAGA